MSDALRVLYDAQPPDLQQGLLIALKELKSGTPPGFEGLFIVSSSKGTVANATWVQPMAGRCTTLWAPSATLPGALQLVQRARDYASSSSAVLTQTLLAPDDTPRRELLTAGGLPTLVDLDYLVAPADVFPHTRPESSLSFEPLGNSPPDRLANVIERSYQDSCDCPQLNGLRQINDVLEGYRHQGRHDPNQWYIVSENDAVVASLILTQHDGDIWELVYMGVVPEARGRSLGHEIVRFAQWTCRNLQAKRLVLAVDAANRPALAMYTLCGFQPFDRRVVHALLAGTISR